MIVGMTVLPARLTRVAPAGAFTSAARPTCVIRPPSTTIAAFSIGALSVADDDARAFEHGDARVCARFEMENAAITSSTKNTRFIEAS